jgi:hypothetical protein
MEWIYCDLMREHGVSGKEILPPSVEDTEQNNTILILASYENINIPSFKDESFVLNKPSKPIKKKFKEK